MDATEVFWELAADLRADDARVVEGTIMGSRCLRVGREFVALVDYKGSGLVVKLSRARVDEIVRSGVGRPFAPAGRVFREWVSIPKIDRRRWRALLREGVAFAVTPETAGSAPASARPRAARAVRGSTSRR